MMVKTLMNGRMSNDLANRIDNEVGESKHQTKEIIMNEERAPKEITPEEAKGLSDGVMRQFFEEEIDRLDKTRSILMESERHPEAQDVFQQIIGVQTFWEILRLAGIAL